MKKKIAALALALMFILLPIEESQASFVEATASAEIQSDFRLRAHRRAVTEATTDTECAVAVSAALKVSASRAIGLVGVTDAALVKRLTASPPACRFSF